MENTGETEFEWLAEPVSDDAPCGPNLETADDPDFIDYYFDAETRLPERYFTPGLKTESGEGTDDRLFDQKSVDLKKEQKNITALLERSRDLRLLSLLARFAILAGKITVFADAVEGIALLLDTYPADVHPVMGKSATNRRMPLDDLGTAVTVTIPLQYVSLTGQPDVTYRRYLVATGKSQPRAGEEEISVSQITDAIAESGARKHVETVFGSLQRAVNAMERIKLVCRAHESAPFTPTFDNTVSLAVEMIEMLGQVLPELGGISKPAPPADAPEEKATADAPAAASPVQAARDTGSAASSVPGPAAAKAVLQAVEQYFARREPSSAAVLLITQARLLIGRPLIEALETLLPEHSKNAVIDFGKETGFALSIDRLRSLSSEIPQGPGEEEPQEIPQIPQINSRLDVGTQIRGVIEYYRLNEPASPIPILLRRANEYLEKDFNAIVAELLPTQSE